MAKHPVGDVILIIFLLFFSGWLMMKSFGYDPALSQFRIARHEVGDFGLHLALIRSFAWGDNYPPVSPFYPGKPLVYHYGIDWFAGLLVRLGIRIDYALNGISAIALTILLYGLYRLTLLLFYGSRVAGLLSIVFFLLPSNLSFVDIFKHAPTNLSIFSYFWRFPDYLHKGPFDGSLITIYTTLAPYLNQRHLIAGIAIGVSMLWMTVDWLNGQKRTPDSRWIFLGVILGATTRVHTVVAAATGILVFLLLLGKRNRALLFFTGASLLTAAPHLMQIIFVRSGAGLSQIWNPGYLAPRPLTGTSWIVFWIYNLGVLVLLIPLAYRLSNGLGRRVLIGAGLLFLIANTVQISHRIEHNHSLINYATVISLPFIANLLVTWWRKRDIRWKLIVISALFISTTSGLFNLMVVKNDYQFVVDDAPKNKFIQWIETQTNSDSIFIAQPALYDPITLAGRKNYLGPEYYVSVMGYEYWNRRKQIDTWLGNINQNNITDMKKQNIRYFAIPKESKDFSYSVDEEKVKSLFPVVYLDETIILYEL